MPRLPKVEINGEQYIRINDCPNIKPVINEIIEYLVDIRDNKRR